MTQQYRMEELDLLQVICNEQVQVRAETNPTTVLEYSDVMETEEDMKRFPPPTVYFDGCYYWLADGHHRYRAAAHRKYQKMLFCVIDGTRDDAILAAVKLNLQNGLRFNENDWEKIILLITSNEQWKNWTSRRLANELGCSEITIRRYRNDNSVATGVATEKRQGKDGKMYKAKKSKKPKEKNATTEVSATSKTDQEKKKAAQQPEATQASETPLVEATQAEVPQTEPSLPEPSPSETPQAEYSQVESSSEEAPQEKNQKYTIEEAKAAEECIFEIITVLGQKITEWFDLAPSELHEDFDNRVRKRLEVLIR